MNEWISAFLGGILIGSGGLLLLAVRGKVFGISGILGGLFTRENDSTWRFHVILGLVAGGIILWFASPGVFELTVVRTPRALIVAGLLVGFGTQLGSGCTSGHGVCGMSRFSPRSIAATLTFMLFGAVTVYVINHLLGGVV